MDSAPQDRRRFPRVRLLTSRELTQQAEVSLTLRDISLGGFCLESTTAFAVGTTHAFALSPSEGRPVVLVATTRHSLRITSPDGQTAYLCGFEFSPLDPVAKIDLARLLNGIRGGEHDVGVHVGEATPDIVR